MTLEIKYNLEINQLKHQRNVEKDKINIFFLNFLIEHKDFLLGFTKSPNRFNDYIENKLMEKIPDLELKKAVYNVTKNKYKSFEDFLSKLYPTSINFYLYKCIHESENFLVALKKLNAFCLKRIDSIYESKINSDDLLENLNTDKEVKDIFNRLEIYDEFVFLVNEAEFDSAEAHFLIDCMLE
ncbi:072R [Cherax quadricarinatus iridovirus]|uniref:072R n=1 Tax=Cherax quadricarinatus iridovirus TaxID=2035708 RepID=UPI000BC04E59|nr:072R [Cherax quadricarinatus iridovirus]ASZ85052.1 072R [Cherax quadricarinatus iridovirus]